MPSLVPYPFLFKLQFAVHPTESASSADLLVTLDESWELPEPAELRPQSPFATLRCGWNGSGIGFVVEVRGRSGPPQCAESSPLESDGLRLWIATRNLVGVHRANRFCHQFVACPTGEERQPFGTSWAIPRATEASPTQVAGRRPETSSRLFDEGYDLAVWLPADVLHGYDPESSPELGFYYEVRDRQLGQQVLSVAGDFPFASDPSLWGVLRLAEKTGSAKRAAPKSRRKTRRSRK